MSKIKSREIERRMHFLFSLAHSTPPHSPPLNPFLLTNFILLEQTSMEKGFQRGIQACLKKDQGHMSRDAALQAPSPTIQSFVVTSLWVGLVCHRVDVIMRCSVFPEERSLRMTTLAIALYENPVLMWGVMNI